MNLEDLRLFALVARAGSFAAAARQSSIPKATLSRRIGTLERDLGVRLLHRSTRRLSLSEGGELLLQRAAPLLDDLVDVGDQVQSLQHEPRGRLRVQMPLEFLNDEVAAALAGFVSAHPQMVVQSTHYIGDAAAGMRQAAEFDLTLLCFELRLPASDWIARPLMSLRQGIFANAELARRAATLADLGRLPAVTAVGEQAWHFRAGPGPAGPSLAGPDTHAVTVAGALELDSPQMRLVAAARGAGLVKAPVALAEPFLAAGRLVPVRFEQEAVALSVAMLYRSRTMPAKVRAFMDFLQSRLALGAAGGSG